MVAGLAYHTKHQYKLTLTNDPEFSPGRYPPFHTLVPSGKYLFSRQVPGICSTLIMNTIAWRANESYYPANSRPLKLSSSIVKYCTIMCEGVFPANTHLFFFFKS